MSRLVLRRRVSGAFRGVALDLSGQLAQRVRTRCLVPYLINQPWWFYSLVTIKLIIGTNLLSYASRRTAGTSRRAEEDDNVNFFGRPAIGEGKAEVVRSCILSYLIGPRKLGASGDCIWMHILRKGGVGLEIGGFDGRAIRPLRCPSTASGSGWFGQRADLSVFLNSHI
jgi:hypothetical protein